MAEEDICVICRDVPVDPARLLCCTAPSCQKCLVYWLREHPTCPLCRRIAPSLTDKLERRLWSTLWCLLFLYLIAILYLNTGMWLGDFCHNGVRLVWFLALPQLIFTLSVMLLPIIALQSAVFLYDPWTKLHRIRDMCGAPGAIGLNYACELVCLPENPFANSTTYVIYGNVGHDRRIECTTYIMIGLVALLQLALLSVGYALYRLRRSKEFILR
jgi:hypothetical protein